MLPLQRGPAALEIRIQVVFSGDTTCGVKSNACLNGRPMSESGYKQLYPSACANDCFAIQ
jgi:hypothetical protein